MMDGIIIYKMGHIHSDDQISPHLTDCSYRDPVQDASVHQKLLLHLHGVEDAGNGAGGPNRFGYQTPAEDHPLAGKEIGSHHRQG